MPAKQGARSRIAAARSHGARNDRRHRPGWARPPTRSTSSVSDKTPPNAISAAWRKPWRTDISPPLAIWRIRLWEPVADCMADGVIGAHRTFVLNGQRVSPRSRWAIPASQESFAGAVAGDTARQIASAARPGGGGRPQRASGARPRGRGIARLGLEPTSIETWMRQQHERVSRRMSGLSQPDRSRPSAHQRIGFQRIIQCG